MNYWLITSEYPPDYGGGISTYCLHTGIMLQEQGWKVSIFVRDFSVKKVVEKFEDSGVRIVRFNPHLASKKHNLGYDAALSYAYAALVEEYLQKEGVPDVLESQEYAGIAYYILNYKHLSYPLFKELKILITLHSPSFLYLEYNKVPLYQFPYFWTGEMEKFCIRAADLLISPSQYLVDELKSRMKIDDLNIHVLANPYVSENNEEQKITRNKLVFFGKLIPQKGCFELIAYFKNLWSKGFEHSLYMIGGGAHLYHPEGMDMIDVIRKKYKKELYAKKLKLLGSIPPAKIAEHLRDAHVIIIPSIVDNLPYTVLEAMSKGKIVLASVQGGQSEVIQTGINGFLFDHQNKNSFEAQLKEILLINDAQLIQLSNSARKRIEDEYGYEKIFRKKSKLLAGNLGRVNKAHFPFINPIQMNEKIDRIKHSSPLLSVVIPFYNMGKYLETAVKSIISSTYKNVFIIVVNDGSSDEQSVKLLNELAQKYNFQVCNKKNEGLALARNTGALEATGELLAFLDPDDTVEPTYYEKAVRVLLQYENIGFVGCWASYFGDSEKIWPTFNPEPPYLLTHNMVNSSGLVYKKQAFINSGLNDAAMIYGMEDYESVINMVKNGNQGVVLPEPLWNYRIRNNSMARAFTKDKQLHLYRLIAHKHSGFLASFAAEISCILNANGPGMYFDNPTIFYDLPGSNFLGQRLKQKLITTIKSNPVLRKVAIKIKKHL